MRPFEGSAVLEMNPTLVFPILEMLLGGNAKATTKITREITEIEQSILERILGIILNDLCQAWHGVAPLDFSIQSQETAPQLLQILAPNEAVVAISIEVRIGENSGMMNIGIPSIVIKMLRQKFDQQWSVRKSKSTGEEQARVLRLIKTAKIHLDTRLQGPTLRASELLEMKAGDVLAFDYSIDRPVDLLINGKLKFRGSMGASGRKKAFLAEKPFALHE